MDTTNTTSEPRRDGSALERQVRPRAATCAPALGYKHYAEVLRRDGMSAPADFVEAQNAEIEYLYAALQRVRNRCGGNQRGIGKVARDVRDIVEAALRYEA